MYRGKVPQRPETGAKFNVEFAPRFTGISFTVLLFAPVRTAVNFQTGRVNDQRNRTIRLRPEFLDRKALATA